MLSIESMLIVGSISFQTEVLGSRSKGDSGSIIPRSGAKLGLKMIQETLFPGVQNRVKGTWSRITNSSIIEDSTISRTSHPQRTHAVAAMKSRGSDLIIVITCDFSAIQGWVRRKWKTKKKRRKTKVIKLRQRALNLILSLSESLLSVTHDGKLIACASTESFSTGKIRAEMLGSRARSRQGAALRFLEPLPSMSAWSAE